ncbi:MAG TPA: hypothetical protein VEK08_17645 [Planctomycetota bacterium]|nr:hypothetical protein [Planctomycetota bacterium]
MKYLVPAFIFPGAVLGLSGLMALVYVSYIHEDLESLEGTVLVGLTGLMISCSLLLTLCGLSAAFIHYLQAKRFPERYSELWL